MRQVSVVQDEAEFGDDVAVAGGVFAVGVDGPEDGDGGAVGGERVESGGFAGMAVEGEGGGCGGAIGVLGG